MLIQRTVRFACAVAMALADNIDYLSSSTAVSGALADDGSISADYGLSLLQHRAQVHRKSNGARAHLGKHGTSSKGIVRLLDFTKAHLVHNNLGGRGPRQTMTDGGNAPEEIRFSNLVQGQDVDLVITAIDGYEPYNVSRNGILGGNAQINTKSGSTVSLNFTFVDAGTYNPHSMPLFYITFSDLDERHGGAEKEMIAVEGFVKYFTNDDLSVVGANTSAPAFESVDYGNYADNELQQDSPEAVRLTHAVTYQFSDKATFRATFIVTKDGNDEKGRNVLFSGISQLVFCQEPSTYLDFGTATVAMNNLGGTGPNNNSNQTGELRYSSIATFAGENLDLLVTAEKDAGLGWDYTPWNASQNGRHGVFGIVNLWSGPSQANSEVHLHFTIVKTGTTTPVTLDAFAFMVFDFDTGLHEQQIEYVELFPTQAGFAGGPGFASFIATATSELNITDLPNGQKRFQASRHGTQADNPLSSQMLAREEADRAVVFTFRNTSEFRLTYGITPNGFNTGRNLMFAGQDMYLMCD